MVPADLRRSHFSVDEDGVRTRYNYAHRNTYLGVVPEDLRNVFFIGYTRPLTGGLANITEMQSLMVHKLLSEPQRVGELYEDIRDRVAEYNTKYYPPGQRRTPTDHLVNYGLYTADVAEFVGIGRKLGSAVSWNPWRTYLNLRFELLHPNNALKYRMQGEYAVEGAENLARKVAAHNEHWSIIMFLLLCCFWDKVLGFLFLAMVMMRFVVQPVMDGFSLEMLPGLLAWTGLCAGGAAVLHRNQRTINLSTYSLTVPLFGLKATTVPLAMIYIVATGQWYLCPALYGFWALVAFAFRQFHRPPISGRYLFADCKYKHRYRPFYERYRSVYLKARAERRQAKAGAETTERASD